MNMCAECLGCALHVLFTKLEDELDRRNVNDYWCLLDTASELVDDLVAQARMPESDQSSSEKDAAKMDSMPAVGSC